jgi:formylglycine-generating enzyme
MKKIHIGVISLPLISMIAVVFGCAPKPVLPPGARKVMTCEGMNLVMIYVPPKRLFTGIDDKGTARVRKGFWISETEVTYELWKAVWNWASRERGYNFANPGIIGSDGHGSAKQPATTLNWRDSIVFCNAASEWFNTKTVTRLGTVYKYRGKPIRDARANNGAACDSVVPDEHADGFRDATSDEWELAARFIADSNEDGDIEDPGEYYPGNFASGASAPCTDSEATRLVAIFLSDSTSDVKSRLPNALGLFDMSGNIDEWCFDPYPGTGVSARISVSGSWIGSAETLQLGTRVRHDPYTENSFIGLRLAMNE